ncbi:hypothetical protein RRG08_042863 [Elysia crispata]|uniref:Uncharacterized protein n=1 Tax=Elysia crispata TaxID=231223 RepID=A0AAE1AHZ1_9GAST|nr:hypothetical protein RRG08_042863 [Elysia crispata]
MIMLCALRSTEYYFKEKDRATFVKNRLKCFVSCDDVKQDFLPWLCLMQSILLIWRHVALIAFLATSHFDRIFGDILLWLQYILNSAVVNEQEQPGLPLDELNVEPK